jgi:uncharacterized glyoxalase superfamily protein PhnB
MPDHQGENNKNLFAVATQFLVKDVIAAAEYYRDKLGFQIGPYARHQEGEPPYFVLVTRDGFYLQLRICTVEPPRSNRTFDREGFDVYYFVKNVDELYREFKFNGAGIVHEPEDKYYSMREMQVEDNNGYLLAFGMPLAHER